MIAPDDQRENRRWLIGIGISLMFGLFGVVMALLSYNRRPSPSAPPSSRVEAEPAGETPRHPRKSGR